MSTCLTCARQLVPQGDWEQADKRQRRHWMDADIRMLKGRGLCRGCYLQARKRGEIPTRADMPTPVPCGRCGLSTTAAICIDCADVAADLHELARLGRMTTYAESSGILAGGRWVADRHGIQRWTPDPRFARDPQETPTTLRSRDPGLRIGA